MNIKKDFEQHGEAVMTSGGYPTGLSYQLMMEKKAVDVINRQPYSGGLLYKPLMRSLLCFRSDLLP
jgi:hypothetical protein